MIPDERAEELWRNCLHEAGHAWAIHALVGEPLGVISMRRGAGHDGIVMGDPERPYRSLSLGPHPLDGLDPAERQLADKWLIVTMIGDQAEDALDVSMPDGGFGDDLDVPETVPAPVAAALAAAEAIPATVTGRHDIRQAYDLAGQLVGSAAAGYYLRWITVEARRLVTEHAAPIHALASALWREPIIDGDRAVAILEEAEGATNG